jgi:hypothetical protein
MRLYGSSSRTSRAASRHANLHRPVSAYDAPAPRRVVAAQPRPQARSARRRALVPRSV